MKKLASAIERKALKAFSKLPESKTLTLNVSFCSGWFGGETQEEDSMVMSLKDSTIPLRTSVRISPFKGVYGSIKLLDSFVSDYNKIKNIRADLTKVIAQFNSELEAKKELDERRKRVPVGSGFRNPLLNW